MIKWSVHLLIEAFLWSFAKAGFVIYIFISKPRCEGVIIVTLSKENADGDGVARRSG